MQYQLIQQECYDVYVRMIRNLTPNFVRSTVVEEPCIGLVRSSNCPLLSKTWHDEAVARRNRYSFNWHLRETLTYYKKKVEYIDRTLYMLCEEYALDISVQALSIVCEYLSDPPTVPKLKWWNPVSDSWESFPMLSRWRVYDLDPAFVNREMWTSIHGRLVWLEGVHPFVTKEDLQKAYTSFAETRNPSEIRTFVTSDDVVHNIEHWYSIMKYSSRLKEPAESRNIPVSRLKPVTK
jgi:hypothetical protein